MRALRDFRKRAGLTQRDVASRLGVTQQAVWKYERGICMPSAHHIRELAKMMGCAETDIISRELKFLRDRISRMEALCEMVAKREEGTE